MSEACLVPDFFRVGVQSDGERASSFSCSFSSKEVSMGKLIRPFALSPVQLPTYLQNHIRIVSSQDVIALDKLSDRELVVLCQRQLPDEIEAFTELVKRYEALVYNFCLKTIGSPQDAEEVAQDALIQVFHKIHQFEGRSAFKTWLYKIVHNYCRNRISKIVRKRQGQEAYEKHMKEEQPSAEQGSSKELDNKARIQDALSRLRSKDKEIITYKFMLGMTLQEISETLGLGTSAAKMRYYRAMEAFKEAYQRTGNHLPNPTNSKR